MAKTACSRSSRCPRRRRWATASPHIVVFGCTSAGALYGKDYDRELCERIGALTGAISVSVISAVNEALRDTGASRVAVITPYVDELNERIQASIEAEDMEVSSMSGMGISNNFDIASVTPDEIVDFVRERVGTRLQGDALFLSCTNFNALSALSTLKTMYGLPVVTSNLAALQAVRGHVDDLRQKALKDAPVAEPIPR